MIDINATLIAQMLNFLVLVVLLRIFAYKPIVKMLKEREERIAGSIKKADDDAAAAEATLKQYQEQLAGARVKAQEIIDKAEKRTREDHEASMQTTKAEIDQMKHAAQLEIQRERALAVEKLNFPLPQLRKSFPRISMLLRMKHLSRSLSTSSIRTRLVICHVKYTACP